MKILVLILTTLVVSGCVIAPREAREEVAHLHTAGAPYSTPRTQRTLEDLPLEPQWPDLLCRAFLASGDLEAAYHEWAMAVSRIDQAGSYPNAPLEIGFETIFSGGGMKAFDRTTFSGGFDDGISLPNKTFQSAKVAWRSVERAKGASGGRYDARRASEGGAARYVWAIVAEA